MHYSSVILALAGASAAVDINMYKGPTDCSKTQDVRRLIWTNVNPNVCYSLDEKNPQHKGVTCTSIDAVPLDWTIQLFIGRNYTCDANKFVYAGEYKGAKTVCLDDKTITGLAYVIPKRTTRSSEARVPRLEGFLERRGPDAVILDDVTGLKFTESWRA